MAVTITRTAWQDDDGSGTVGTVINNAVKTSIYDQIDAALAALSVGVNTIVTVGTITTGVWNAGAVTSSGDITYGGNAATYGLIATGTNGLGIAATHGSGAIRFYSGGTTLRADLGTAGDFGLGVASSTAHRLAVKGSGTSSAARALYLTDSASGELFFVRNDGYLVFGASSIASSPYNQTTATAANAVLASNGEIQRSTSSLKFKTDLQPLVASRVRDVLTALAIGDAAGFTYRSIGKADDQRTRFVGWGAERVEAVEPLLVAHDRDGRPNNVMYDRVSVYLTRGWQQHDASLAAMTARIAALEGRMH